MGVKGVAAASASTRASACACIFTSGDDEQNAGQLGIVMMCALMVLQWQV